MRTPTPCLSRRHSRRLGSAAAWASSSSSLASPSPSSRPATLQQAWLRLDPGCGTRSPFSSASFSTGSLPRHTHRILNSFCNRLVPHLYLREVHNEPTHRTTERRRRPSPHPRPPRGHCRQRLGRPAGSIGPACVDVRSSTGAIITLQRCVYQVALAVLSPADIRAAHLDSILRKNKTPRSSWMKWPPSTWPRAQVTLGSGARVPYDYLVLATAQTHSYFAPRVGAARSRAQTSRTQRDSTAAFCWPLSSPSAVVEHGWPPAPQLRRHRRGPTGVELAGAISDIAQLYMRHDFRTSPLQGRVLLLEGSPRVPPPILTIFQRRLKPADQLRRRGPHQHKGQCRRPRLG